MFRLAVLTLLTTGATMAFENSIRASSKAGQRLLKNARLVRSGKSEWSQRHEERRKLNQEQEEDFSWIADLSLKYEGCYNTVVLSDEGGEDGESPIQNVGVVTFSLCYSGCSSCNAGTYATDMTEFVDAYTESQMEMAEYQCEKARENFNCDNDDDAVDEEYCEQQGWYDAGMDYCVDADNGDGQEEFEVQRYLECAEMENNNDDDYNKNQNGNNKYANGYSGYQVYKNWDGEYRVGPYCAADGKSIFLGVFYDEQCTISAGDGAYATMNYAQLPYSANSQEGSLIPVDECVSCFNQQQWDEQQEQQYEYYQQQQYNNNNGNNNNGNNNNNNNNNGNNNNQWNQEPSEFCMRSYEESAKCNNDNQSGCNFINDFLTTLGGKATIKYVGAPNDNAAVVFAWLFGSLTVLFGLYSFYLYIKIKRNEVDLIEEPL